jgi:pimeloyl-ACP methyl ester carboxylesterase
LLCNHFFVQQGDVKLHVLDSGDEAASSLCPVMVSPGLSETAEEYEEFMREMLPRRTVVLSYRGRGLSSTPESGYGLEEHVSDLAAVIRARGLSRFHLFAYSRGVSYALGYASRHTEGIVSLSLQDYPASHLAMPSGWAEDYITNYLEPFGRTSNIRPAAVRAIGAESKNLPFEIRFPFPILVMRGTLEGSLLPDEELQAYLVSGKVTVKNFSRSGHDIRSAEKELFYQTVIGFIDEKEAACTLD